MMVRRYKHIIIKHYSHAYFFILRFIQSGFSPSSKQTIKPIYPTGRGFQAGFRNALRCALTYPTQQSLSLMRACAEINGCTFEKAVVTIAGLSL
jgi:hypothetical protein